MERPPTAWDRFYHTQVAPWRGERSLEPFAPVLQGQRVLELGVGNGKTLRSLQQSGFDAVGLDVSWNVVARHGTGILGDASLLPFQDASFDTVLDIHCLGHVGKARRQQGFARIYDVLRSGGGIAVERLGAVDLRAKQGQPVPGEPDMRQLQDGRRTQFPTRDALMSELQQAGFEILQASTITRSPKLRGIITTRQWVRMLARKP